MENKPLPSVFFKAYCPALKQEVHIFRDTWFGHIIKPITGHQDMQHKRPLVERAIKSIENSRNFFRFSDYPEGEWFSDFQCPDFGRCNPYLRIGFKKVSDYGDEIVIMTTAFPANRGVISYEP